MKIYTVYAKETDSAPMENMILIKEGFSWKAFIFGFMLAIYYRMWRVGFLLLSVELLLNILAIKFTNYSEIISSISLGVLIFTGCNFNDWRRKSLEREQYSYCGVVCGKNIYKASFRFIEMILQRTDVNSENHY